MGAATVRAAVLKNYAEVAQTHGLNSTKMLRGVGLAPSMLVDPERMIPFESVLKLLEDSAQQSGCQTFGLSMAETRQLSDFGVVSLLISHQRTLRDALTTTIEYRHLLNQTLAMDIKIFGKTAIIREEVMVEAGLPKRQATELARFCSMRNSMASSATPMIWINPIPKPTRQWPPMRVDSWTRCRILMMIR